MTRRNIFEILEGKIDLQEEIARLEQLSKSNIVQLDDLWNWSFEEFIDRYCLSEWKNRNRCINYKDMRTKLDITEFQMKGKTSREQKLRYFEFMANMVYICQKGFDSFNGFDQYNETANYWCIKENLESIVSCMNMELKVLEEKDQVLLIEKDPAATAVAEIVEQEIAYNVIEYNHYLLKGNIEEKQKLLKVLADKFEAIRPQLKLINGTLESNTGYLLNKMNIRHNNLSGKNAVPYVKDLSKKRLEEWYDEIYQMILLSILEVDNMERNEKVKELKQIIEGK